MSDIYKNLDVSKLEFKQQYLEGGTIYIRIPSLNRMHPVTREVMLTSIKHGNHHDKIANLFTPESIKKSTKAPKSKEKNES